MKHFLLLFVAIAAHAQTLNCSLPVAGLGANGPPLYIKAVLMPSGAYVCERVYPNVATTQETRDAVTKLLTITAIPGAPPPDYRTIFEAEYKSSNTKESVSNPPTPFDGQIVWCSTSGQQSAENQIVTDAQQARSRPITITEVRAGVGSTVLTSNNKAWPNNAFRRWNNSHPACNGLPGLTFAVGADLVYQQDGNTSPAPLLQLWIVSIIPSV